MTDDNNNNEIESLSRRRFLQRAAISGVTAVVAAKQAKQSLAHKALDVASNALESSNPKTGFKAPHGSGLWAVEQYFEYKPVDRVFLLPQRSEKHLVANRQVENDTSVKHTDYLPNIIRFTADICNAAIDYKRAQELEKFSHECTGETSFNIGTALNLVFELGNTPEQFAANNETDDPFVHLSLFSHPSYKEAEVHIQHAAQGALEEIRATKLNNIMSETVELLETLLGEAQNYEYCEEVTALLDARAEILSSAIEEHGDVLNIDEIQYLFEINHLTTVSEFLEHEEELKNPKMLTSPKQKYETETIAWLDQACAPASLFTPEPDGIGAAIYDERLDQPKQLSKD